MKDYIKIIKNDHQLLVCFYIETTKVMTIGEKMNEINEMAYMNGYNWDAFLNFYLKREHPEVLKGMGTDPEAGTYVAYYELNPENEKKAAQLARIIEDLVENEAKLYEIVSNNGEEIEWD